MSDVNPLYIEKKVKHRLILYEGCKLEWIQCYQCYHVHPRSARCLTQEEFKESMNFSCYWVFDNPYLDFECLENPKSLKVAENTMSDRMRSPFFNDANCAE